MILQNLCGKCGHWRPPGTLVRCPRCGVKLCSKCHVEHPDECDASAPFIMTADRLSTIQDALEEAVVFIESIQDGEDYSARQFADCVVQIKEAALIAEAAFFTVKRAEKERKVA